MTIVTDTSADHCYSQYQAVIGLAFMSLKENFIRNFSFWLESEGKKQKWVAQHLGVTDTTVTRWKKGTREPSLDQIGKIADLMGIPACLLMEERGMESPREALNRIASELKKI